MRARTALYYAGAVAGVGLAVALRVALAPYVGDQLPFSAFYIAVTLIVYLAGPGPAMLAAVLGLVLANMLFVPPVGTIATDVAQLMTSTAYLLACAAIVLFGNGLRQARARAEQSAREATRRGEDLSREAAERREAELEVRRLNTELAAADKRKDEFLATLAHELRNPLAPMRNALELMRLSGFDRAVVSRSGGVLERQLDQMVRLVDDLLEVSRITRGRVALKREWIDLAEVVRHAIETSQPMLEAAGLTLEYTVPTEPLLVHGDPTRLGQVVANLLNNAGKFTDAGGKVTVAVERVEGPRGADAGQHADEAVIRVRDNGVGIPGDMLDRIFDMFTQADRTLERSRGGLGIGLSLARGLVEMHGGTLEAHSEGQNRGSEFVVRLRAQLRQAATEATPRSAGFPSGNPCAQRRILVIDDNRDAAESMAELMGMLGHQVAVGHDGPAALSLARSFRPEVVLLDIGLPGMSGYEVARHIRREPGLERTMLVAVTGWGQDEDRARSREAGFDRHVVKPPDLDVLQELLSAHA